MKGISRRAVIAGAIGLVAATRGQTTLKTPDGRDIRVFTWMPAGRERGVILFSHGALSTPTKYERLLTPWAAAGFRILAPLHVDSTDHPDHAKYGMLESWRARLQDMRALAAFAAADSFIAAGHSYGALVALTLGGAQSEPPPGFAAPLRDPRVHSVVAFSPPGPSPGLVTAAGYATLATPALIETGDHDIPFGIKDGDWHVHLSAYDNAPPGHKYALTLGGVDHYFGGLICNFDRPGPPQTAQLASAVDISTQFLQAFGANDSSARTALDARIGAPGSVQLLRK